MGIYLAIFSSYWLYNLVHMMLDLKAAARIRHFTTHKLGLSERQLQSVTWPEIAHRIVLVSLSAFSPQPACATLSPKLRKKLKANNDGCSSLLKEGIDPKLICRWLTTMHDRPVRRNKGVQSFNKAYLLLQ